MTMDVIDCTCIIDDTCSCLANDSCTCECGCVDCVNTYEGYVGNHQCGCGGNCSCGALSPDG